MPFQRLNELEAPELVEIRVNGKPVQASEGESLHAALTVAGFLSLGKSQQKKRDRGVFCGMGVCYECLVTVDGKPNQRACMTPVRRGMEVEINHA